ncbi:MAG: thermonuclease family protein [Deltaproteobacteria bacterium]|jgi:micrococcal nuclease
MRSKLLAIFIALPVLFLCAVGFTGEGVHVRNIFDGDTISLERGEHVRYAGIDTPEIDHESNKAEYMAYEATNLNRELVSNRRVVLERAPETRDRYGRVLGYIFLQDGRMVNDLLVSEGLAVVSTNPPNLKYRWRLLRSQRHAMASRKGIWRRLPKGETSSYVGNKRSYRFHTQDCPFGRRISKRNRIPLSSLYDAFWGGYSPCKLCNPAAILKEVQ